MDNVVSLPFSSPPNKEQPSFVSRVMNALSGLPEAEQERMVRIFELMALSMEIELMERNSDPRQPR